MRSSGKLKPQQQISYIIRDREQLAALKAAARQELLDVLSSMGTVSIAELAAALDRPADSLYYHMRILQKVGLVHENGVREVAGHSERLYGAVSSDLRLAYTPGEKGNAAAVTPIIDSMLRLTSRDFEAAFVGLWVILDSSGRVYYFANCANVSR